MCLGRNIYTQALFTERVFLFGRQWRKTYSIHNLKRAFRELQRSHSKRQRYLYPQCGDRQTDWLQTWTCNVNFFPLISGYCFSKLPQATEEHLRSPRPTACLLIATLRLCHMSSWWHRPSVCISESTSTQVKMLGLPRSSQKPLVWVRICLAAVPWHGGNCVHTSPCRLGRVCVCACAGACVCMCKCMRVCACVWVRVCMHVWAHASIYATSR